MQLFDGPKKKALESTVRPLELEPEQAGDSEQELLLPPFVAYDFEAGRSRHHHVFDVYITFLVEPKINT